ncbi:hypothetical protein LK542_16235 [Massilia sp. IC2-477]|uniref:hypothetical protein n=1 Tax=Massilia sp. IC2-477 TaxID=2887198 RepID=UPI001D1075A6|nr:hypothetical protein [Massilia sp. IC2-477]MCC2957166.1 hypothetical protein [Massilia sp. IC2-477]
MNFMIAPGRALMRHAATALLLAGSALLTGCASFYVDTATKEVAAAQYKKVAQPRPVQLTFEFQSAGAPNARATELLRGQVTDQVMASGLFSGIVADGKAPLLNVTVNNLPADTGSAAAKGFVTGLTFGLAGNVVTDYYECKVTYLAPGQTTPVVTSARHAIHTAMGVTSDPPNATKSASVEDAVRSMTRQIVSNALNDLSQQSVLN